MPLAISSGLDLDYLNFCDSKDCYVNDDYYCTLFSYYQFLSSFLRNEALRHQFIVSLKKSVRKSI